MLCPKCDAQLSDSAVICRACGAMLPEQPAATQVPYPPASQPAETAASAQPNAPRTCARCGAPLEDGVRFCTNCGAPVPEQPASADPAQSVPPQQDTANAPYTGAAAPFGPGICPRCGSRLAPGARFCTVCGMPAPEAPQGQADWYAPAPGGTVSSPEIGPKHKPKKLLIGLLCGFAALVVIVAVVAGIFAARQASAPSTAGGAEVDRLIDLINDILKLSELESVTIPQSEERSDVLTIARDTAAFLTPTAKAAEVTLSVDGGPATVAVPQGRLKELLLNLVGNGIKYNEPGGTVRTAVSVRDGQAVIAVSDTGIGIPPADQSRVFER